MGTEVECPICCRIVDLSIFTEEHPLDPFEEHFSYCPVVDKNHPIWKESLATLPERKYHNISTAVKSIWNVKSVLKNIFE